MNYYIPELEEILLDNSMSIFWLDLYHSKPQWGTLIGEEL